MSEIKYMYKQMGNYRFRIKMEKINDCDFANGIRYQIQEPLDIPRSIKERIKQWFTIHEYGYGYWFPTLSTVTFEEHLFSAMNGIIENWERSEKADEEWNKII